MSIYNEKKQYIINAIESIRNQSFYDLEFIIINDNPNREDIKPILKKINDKRIILIENRENIGLANSMNVAVSAVRGDYIVRMDADDISNVHRIEKQLKYLQKSNLDICSTYYHYIDENGEKLSKKPIKYSAKAINKLIPFFSPICHPTVMMTKKLFDEMQGYNDYPCSQDYDLWLRIKNSGYCFGYLDEDLYGYRIRTDSITSKMNYIQTYTSCYQKKINRNKKEFCRRDYEKYMKKISLYDEKSVEKYRESYDYHDCGLKCANQRKWGRFIWNEIRALFHSNIYRVVMLVELKKKILIKIFI